MNERQIISLATKDSAFGLNAMGIFLFGGAMAGLTGAAIKPRSERMFLLFLGLLQEATGKSTGKRILSILNGAKPRKSNCASASSTV